LVFAFFLTSSFVMSLAFPRGGSLRRVLDERMIVRSVGGCRGSGQRCRNLESCWGAYEAQLPPATQFFFDLAALFACPLQLGLRESQGLIEKKWALK
jgi:hypothetical protein